MIKLTPVTTNSSMVGRAGNADLGGQTRRQRQVHQYRSDQSQASASALPGRDRRWEHDEDGRLIGLDVLL